MFTFMSMFIFTGWTAEWGRLMSLSVGSTSEERMLATSMSADQGQDDAQGLDPTLTLAVHLVRKGFIGRKLTMMMTSSKDDLDDEIYANQSSDSGSFFGGP
ncbi:hypothetical protein FFLO_02849 [Filobasidium floriforme]|uniref:Uncharacterized protein n=1 Tax=Filobasidium floriforme TaxID=5210 RepID=A0A8K0NTN3_9TREE|nr:uncharacterized protein HD553DRAFT_366747 [Filobasidium floriforme]KAG7558196.1 hypothetical protein FFLO_02849 [Filobasidium floriforme]KAH8088536.1 hypothetical protein HD553DRAFT_366747 [Filobasidium floriforme]